MNPDQIRASFSMAERPLKLLLKSYFNCFSSEVVDDFCKKAKIPRNKVPKKYMNTANINKTMDSLPPELLDRTSLNCIPKRPGEMKIEKPNGDVWLMANTLSEAASIVFRFSQT